jgi:ribosomal protein L37AE/L43A
MNFASDLTVTTSGLSAIKTGFDLVKSVAELLKEDKVDAMEISNQLLALQNHLLDARSALTDAKDYIAKLGNEIASKKQIEELEKLMVYDQSVYWKRTGNGDELEPHCTVCWEEDRRLSHLRPSATKGIYSCQICRSTYATAEYSPHTSRPRPRGSWQS